METKLPRNRGVFEMMLIILALGMAAILSQMGGYKMVVLNLFFLPIVLSGYYLGRSSACVLALFSALAVTIVVTWDGACLAAFDTPLMVGLAITLWAGTLGLTAILVGTLCDERAGTVKELHNAYVGVVEVLARYLQGASSGVKARPQRVAELSQLVAEEMNLSPKQVDDIRVAALLQDLDHVEITTQTISKAVTVLENAPVGEQSHTFRGTELVHSLGTVLHGALPLLLSEQGHASAPPSGAAPQSMDLAPLGARIIQAVRAYDALVSANEAPSLALSRDAIITLCSDTSSGCDPQVLNAMERALRRSAHPYACELASS